MKDYAKIAEGLMNLVEGVEEVISTKEYVAGINNEHEALYLCKYEEEKEMLESLESMPKEKAVEAFAKLYEVDKEKLKNEIQLLCHGEIKDDGSIGTTIKIQGKTDDLLFLLKELICKMAKLDIPLEILAFTTAFALAEAQAEMEESNEKN